MKMKNEEEKNEDLFYLAKIFQFQFISEALKLADFKYSMYVFRFFISFFDQKLQSSKVG